MVIISGHGFKLRPLSIKDLDGFFEIMQDADTMKNLNSVPETIEDAKEELNEMLNKVRNRISEIFTIEINGEYAGNVTLEHQNYDPANDEGRLHILIHPKFRGRGLATNVLKTVMEYGFKKRKYKRIYAQCKASNIPVVKVNEKLGMKVIKEHVNESGVKKILWVKES